ncbi:MAG: hypothetical protein ABSD82_00115 [Solirubrobacteraceae bacterium]
MPSLPVPDFVGSAMRSTLKLLGGAEHEVEEHTPVEQPLHEAVAALHHAAESMDHHVEVLEAVAATLPELTGALVKLTEQLGEVLRMAAPLEAAEREVAGIGHLFRRRRSRPALPAGPPAVPVEAPAAAQTYAEPRESGGHQNSVAPAAAPASSEPGDAGPGDASDLADAGPPKPAAAASPEPGEAGPLEAAAAASPEPGEAGPLEATAAAAEHEHDEPLG